MHEPPLREVQGAPGIDRTVPANAGHTRAGGHPATPGVPTTGRKQLSVTFRRLLNQEPEGEAAAPPPPAIDYSAPPPIPVRKPWPVLLAQAMRTGRYLNAQVALVGAVECRSPDPVTVLTIGGRWQVTHRQLRTARAGLPEAQQAQLVSYLLRDDVLVRGLDQDGREHYQAHAPTMDQDEEAAFSALWRALRGGGVLERLPNTRESSEATPPPPMGAT